MFCKLLESAVSLMMKIGNALSSLLLLYKVLVNWLYSNKGGLKLYQLISSKFVCTNLLANPEYGASMYVLTAACVEHNDNPEY